MNLTPLDNPKQWVSLPYSKDCSQAICTLYCPQWCYSIPPPPPFIQFSDENSGPSFSPLIISIIGILASACLLVSYYVILTKYCRDRASSTRRLNQDMEFRDIHEDSRQAPFFVASNGLDEAMIKSITVFKYKKSGDGSGDIVLQKDCSICLSEFEENESLRLLPKCCHAFHVPCIDTWFKSHSNCPLCRANVVSVDTSPCLLPLESPPIENVGMVENVEIFIRDEEDGVRNVAPKTSYRGSGSGEQVIDIRNDETLT